MIKFNKDAFKADGSVVAAAKYNGCRQQRQRGRADLAEQREAGRDGPARGGHVCCRLRHGSGRVVSGLIPPLGIDLLSPDDPDWTPKDMGWRA